MKIDNAVRIASQIRTFKFLAEDLFKNREGFDFKDVYHGDNMFSCKVIPIKDVLSVLEKTPCKKCGNKGYNIFFKDIIKENLSWNITPDKDGTWCIIEPDRYEYIRKNAGASLYKKKEGTEELEKCPKCLGLSDKINICDACDDTGLVKAGKIPKQLRIVVTCGCIEKELLKTHPNYYPKNNRTEWYYIESRPATEDEIKIQKDKEEKEKLLAEAINEASKRTPSCFGKFGSKLINPTFQINYREECEKRGLEHGFDAVDSEEWKQIIASSNAGNSIEGFVFSGIAKDLQKPLFREAYLNECKKLDIKPIELFGVFEKEKNILLNSAWYDRKNADLLLGHMEKEFPGKYEIRDFWNVK